MIFKKYETTRAQFLDYWGTQKCKEKSLKLKKWSKLRNLAKKWHASLYSNELNSEHQFPSAYQKSV